MTTDDVEAAIVRQRDQLRALFDQTVDQLHAEGDNVRYARLLTLNAGVSAAILALMRALREARADDA